MSIPPGLLSELRISDVVTFLAVHRCDLRRTVTGAPDPACDGRMRTILLVTADAGRTWMRVGD